MASISFSVGTPCPSNTHAPITATAKGFLGGKSFTRIYHVDELRESPTEDDMETFLLTLYRLIARDKTRAQTRNALNTKELVFETKAPA